MSETNAQSQNDVYAVSVGTSATVLVEGGGENQQGANKSGAGFPRVVTVHNNHASQTLYVGFGSDLTTSSGLPVPSNNYKMFSLVYTDEMWAIASGAGTDARVMVVHGKGNPA